MPSKSRSHRAPGEETNRQYTGRDHKDRCAITAVADDKRARHVPVVWRPHQPCATTRPQHTPGQQGLPVPHRSDEYNDDTDRASISAEFAEHETAVAAPGPGLPR